MKIRLSISFEPVNEDWRAYCEHALQLLHTSPNTPATLTVDLVTGVYAFTVKGLQSPAYFKCRWATDDAQATLHRWAVNLGQKAVCLTPHVETSKRISGGEALFLAASIEGPDRDVGVFRLCSQLVHNAERLSDEDLKVLRALVAKVTSEPSDAHIR